MDDDRVPLRKGKRMAFEYDGLEAGELAWIMSKTFMPLPMSEGEPMINLASALQYPSYVSSHSHTADLVAPLKSSMDVDALNLGGDGSLMNQEGVLNGFGVDRMTRLAYTSWIEAYFKHRIGKQWIDMCKSDLGDPMFRALDNTLDDFRLAITGASLFAVPDLTHALEYLPHDADEFTNDKGKSQRRGQTMQPLPQGLFILEQGPFLRSMGVSTEVSEIRIPHGDPVLVHSALDARQPRVEVTDVGFSMSSDRSAPRHLGGELAQRGLYALLKQHGVFNWTPDGIVLSKLETGPSPGADAELDARQGQMFNVSIQGPAITKTWTGDAKMACQPMDKVFMLVVGDIEYKLTGADPTAAEKHTMKACRDMSLALRKIMRPSRTKETEFPTSTNAPNSNFGPGNRSSRVANTFGDFLDTPESTPESKDEFQAALRNMMDAATKREGSGEVRGMRDLLVQIKNRETFFATALQQNKETAMKWYDNQKPYVMGKNRNDAPETMTGDTGVKQLRELLNITLLGFTDNNDPTDDRRAVFQEEFYDKQKEVLNGSSTPTIATLHNMRLMRCTSSYLAQYSYPKQNDAQSRLGLNITYNVKEGSGLASFVLGGWCVGTVLDSAASRSMQGPMVRVAPQSMAMNVNVNVEWWSPDKLHQHYGDAQSWNQAVESSDSKQRTNTVRTRTESRYAFDEQREGQDLGLPSAFRLGPSLSTAQDLKGKDRVKRDITPADYVGAPDSDVGRENAYRLDGERVVAEGWKMMDK